MAGTGNHNCTTNTGLLQKSKQFSSIHLLKGQANEAQEGNSIHSLPKQKNEALGWICCAPCIWLNTSVTVRKIAITTATLAVTSLLVASPILFLISTAPSRHPKECFSGRDGCTTALSEPPTCSEEICKIIAAKIHAQVDWNLDPCYQFKNFSCSFDSRKGMPASPQSIQGNVDIQMQRLLQHNTTTGPFRKLGRLFSSCLRQKTNSPTIKFLLEQLGGYLPIGALGPTSLSSLILKMYKLGFNPLFDLYYDLSYGRRPKVLLIIGGPGPSSPVLEDNIRWQGPIAPSFQLRQQENKQLKKLIDGFLPNELLMDQKNSEKEAISFFIDEFNFIREKYSFRDFWNSSVLNNVSTLQQIFPIINWTELVPKNWNKPFVIRSPDYLKAIQILQTKYSTRVAHNSILMLFSLGLLPQDYPNPTICTQATMWALPVITSTLFVSHHSNSNLEAVIKKTDLIFKSLKAYLKRAPSLKGAALVKLSSLRIRSQLWNGFTNITAAERELESLDITADNWVLNILNICERNKLDPNLVSVDIDSHDAFAYPIVSKVFYDALSHSIAVPLSVMLVPFLNENLPPYLSYASIGVCIAKEILRSITKTFEDKTIRCVPDSVNIFSNHSQMDILIHSGGMQISYHSMLAISGSMKGMTRLPGLNLTPPQVFFLITAQELCEESIYIGVDIEAVNFQDILIWLIAQGGSAAEVFKCPFGSVLDDQKTCNVL